VSLTAAATDRPPTARGGAGTVHQATLERALGRILAVFLALTVVAFWASSGTLPGQRTGGVAADLLLSVLLAGQAARALRRRPSQRDLVLLAGATGSLLLVSRALAVPGSPSPLKPPVPVPATVTARRDPARTSCTRCAVGSAMKRSPCPSTATSLG